MGFVHRALYTWFVVLVFLILLCLRLETRNNWSWFIIFTPIWLYDGVLLIYIIIKVISKWGNVFFRWSTLKEIYSEYRWTIFVLIKLVVQFNLCLILERPDLNYSIFMVMVPVWVLLTSCIIFVFYKLINVE